MPHTSATGGFLLPSTNTLDDQALDHLFHDLIVGVTGLDPTLVRPRWQPEPGNMPAFNTPWIAQGITDRRDDVVASQTYIEGTGLVVTRNQELDCLVSVYGSIAATIEANLRDGLSVDQNREYINSQGIVLVSVGNPRNATMLINERWQKRLDVVITFRRTISRIYAVESLVAAQIQLITDSTNAMIYVP